MTHSSWVNIQGGWYKTLILPPNAAGSTDAVSAWLIGFPVRGRVIPPHRPSIRFLFAGSEVCRWLPLHRASLQRSCPWLTVRANRPAEDLRLQDQCHAWHTAMTPRLRARQICAPEFMERKLYLNLFSSKCKKQSPSAPGAPRPEQVVARRSTAGAAPGQCSIPAGPA